MQELKMRHKAAEGSKCRNGKAGKEKYGTPYVKSEPVRVPPTQRRPNKSVHLSL